MTRDHFKPPFNLAIVSASVDLLSETFIRNHINQIAPGHTLVCSFVDRGLGNVDEAVLHVPPLHYKKSGSIYAALKNIFSITLGTPYLLGKKNRAALNKAFDEHSIGVVLGEFGHNAAVIASYCKERGVPLVTHFHGADASRSLGNRYKRATMRRAAEISAKIICPSEFLRQNLICAGVNGDKIIVIPYGIDVAKFKFADKRDENLVLSVGRFVEKKAPLLVIKAFLRAAELNPQLRLDMIGDGPDLERCRSYLKSQPNTTRIRLLGSQPSSAVAEALSKAGLFIQHSITSKLGETEGLPNTVLEAMAAGAVVVSTRHAGIPEAIREGVDGHLVDENDWERMGDLLSETYRNPDFVQACRRNARQRALSEFSLEVQQQRLRSLLFGMS